MIDTTRHMEIFDAHNFNTPVHVIGVGATGSWLVLQLVKLGITDITIWDYDTIEEHNVANQSFNMADVGKAKVNALSDMALAMSGTKVKTMNEKYIDQHLAGIVFLMVDSMAERKRIWEASIRLKPQVKHLIEPRMGLDLGRVYNVNPVNMNHIKKYEETYYSDEGAEVSACGASMTVVTTSMAIASWCVRQLVNLSNETELDNEILIDFMYNNVFTNKW